MKKWRQKSITLHLSEIHEVDNGEYGYNHSKSYSLYQTACNFF